jgi:hypothetical protein
LIVVSLLLGSSSLLSPEATPMQLAKRLFAHSESNQELSWAYFL